MKKIIFLSILLIALISIPLTSCFIISSECDACQEAQPLTFSINERFTLSKHLNSVPLTMEAVIQFTPSAEFTTSSGATIFGNDDMWSRCVKYTVDTEGHPHVFFKNKNVYKTGTEYVFDNVDLRSNENVHLAITFDIENSKLLCYKNGELAQTIENIEIKENYELKHNFAIGGDYRGANAEHFTGSISSVSIWSDVRTADEIANDYASALDFTDENMLASYDLTKCYYCLKEDKSLNKNNLNYQKLWQNKDEVEEVNDYAYSFAVIGDTQELSDDFPEKMTALYDWLLDNKDAKKIKCVLGLGDITQKSYDYEWAHAKSQIFKLNGKIPYALVRGNHDKIAGYNATFNNEEYKNELSGAMTSDSVTNAYKLLTVGENDYLIVMLDYGPSDAMLNWANEVIASYPNHRAIVITHCYFYRDSTTLGADDAYPSKTNNGEQIWDKLIRKHANIELVISGHDPSQDITHAEAIGDNGNVVHQMLIDPQNTDFYLDGTGMVAMFYFSEDGNTLTVRYYSVIKDMYGSEKSQFTINFNK